MFQKKGQLTIFMILGIVLLLSVVLLFIARQQIVQIREEVPEAIITHRVATNPIKAYFEDCLASIAKDAIYLVSYYGGYLYPSGIDKYNEPGNGDEWYNYYYFNEVQLPFLLDEQTIKIRPLNEIKEIISNYVQVEVQTCFEGLEIFERQGFSIKYPQVPGKVSTTIQRDKVLLSVHSPFSVSRDEKITYFREFSPTVAVRLGNTYDTVEKILLNIKEKQPLDLSEQCDQYTDNLTNIYFESNDYTFEYVVRIVDIFGDPPLIFQFAIKNVDVQGECSG